MNEEKTHYRKAFNSPYLSSADIVDPTVLTISHVRLEPDKSKKTKELFNTAYFKEKEIRKGEPLKPMVLNVVNSRTLSVFSNSKFIDDWNMIPVTIYVDYNVRFGRDMVEGLRISGQTPVLEKPELTPESKGWDRAVVVYSETNSFDRIEAKMTVSDKIKELIIEKNKRNILANSGDYNVD